MHLIFNCFAIIVFAGALVSGQSVVGKDIRVSTFSRGDATEAFYNAAQKSASLVKDSGGVVLVRICSGERLDVAIAKASGNAANIVTNIRNLGLSLDQLYFSTNSRCASKNARATGTIQFLVVNRRSRMLDGSSVAASHVSIKDYDYPENVSEFQVRLNEFLSDLKAESAGKAFVIVYSRSIRSRTLHARVREVERALKNAGPKLPARVTVLDLEWYGVPGDQVNLDFPSFRIVTLHN